MTDLIAQRIQQEAAGLIQQCDTPDAARDLLEALGSSEENAVSGTRKALQFVLSGSKGASLKEIHSLLTQLPQATRQTALQLLQTALFGEQHKLWHDLWHAEGIAGETAMVVLCTLCGEEKDWAAFFDALLPDATPTSQALAMGQDPVQSLLFAASVLRDFSMQEEGEAMAAQLQSIRPQDFLHVRGMGLKRKELSALRNGECWQETGLPKSLYTLLYQKR